MTDPNCVINPRTGRACKTSGKLGQRLLKEQNANKTPHTMYKSVNDVRPNRKDFQKKKELEKTKTVKPETVKPKTVENKTNNLFVLKNTLKQIAKDHPTLKMDYWELLEPQDFFKKLNKIDNSITHKNVEYLFDTRRQDWGKFFEEIFLKDKKELEKPKTVEKNNEPIQNKDLIFDLFKKYNFDYSISEMNKKDYSTAETRQAIIDQLKRDEDNIFKTAQKVGFNTGSINRKYTPSMHGDLNKKEQDILNEYFSVSNKYYNTFQRRYTKANKLFQKKIKKKK